MIIYTDPGLEQIRFGSTLWQMHRRGGPYKKPKPSKNPFDGKPFMKGIVLKTVIRKPKKPNSANRKCVVVRLSNGKEMTAYVPGKIRVIPTCVIFDSRVITAPWKLRASRSVLVIKFG